MGISGHQSPIPIYTSQGDAEAFLVYPYLFNRNGDWIGWVTSKREVYSILGHYVGYVSNEPRILRRRATSKLWNKLDPPPAPEHFLAPPIIPLAPLMPDLTSSVIDVLLEEPDRLHTADCGELRVDID
ncbi:MAG: hypothetical protein A2Y54_10530 [Chloroflexi bacterium RBG_16_51_16]|nr:MAG: hypothetical protein A2Y54_10530 [Chloroflexi bacterium RBG_16_51_16]